MDVLADAGYRPTVFRKLVSEDRSVRHTYDPAADPAQASRLQLSGANRWLWRAAQRRPWTPDTHALFPPAFRAAVRTLLLVAHRGAQAPELPECKGGSSAGATCLAQLGPELLAAVAGAAAYPLSDWRPPMLEYSLPPNGIFSMRWERSSRRCFVR